MAELHERNPNTECLTCHKAIYRRPIQIRQGRVFCSNECYGKANRKEIPCIMCGTPILASSHKKTCSRACANKHRAGITYGHNRPHDKVKDQRALKIRLLTDRGTRCERCGYIKQEILHVHHKDRDRTHNDLENLELLCPNCHAEEHYLEKSWLSSRSRQ